MKNRLNIFAINLPAFHRVPENDEWWGEGFTEWDNVKSGVSLFKGHHQPFVPLNNYYYDLSKKEDILHQIELAKKYGINGFIYYHYWFGEGRQIFEKPVEMIRDDKKMNINYCFCWANESWRTTWHGKDPTKLLLEQKYGDEIEWKKHIDYLISFFMDERYIKIDNKPVLFIYMPNRIDRFDLMMNLFENELKKAGFEGLYLVEYISSKNRDLFSNRSSAVMEFEPLYSTFFDISIINKAKRFLCKKLKLLDIQSYKKICNQIVTRKRTYYGKKIIKCMLAGWDNSARKGKQSMVMKDSSPELFEEYLEKLLSNNRNDSLNDFIVINAWNEWSEGAYLEPDELNKYKYLEAIERVKKKYE